MQTATSLTVGTLVLLIIALGFSTALGHHLLDIARRYIGEKMRWSWLVPPVAMIQLNTAGAPPQSAAGTDPRAAAAPPKPAAGAAPDLPVITVKPIADMQKAGTPFQTGLLNFDPLQFDEYRKLGAGLSTGSIASTEEVGLLYQWYQKAYGPSALAKSIAPTDALTIWASMGPKMIDAFFVNWLKGIGTAESARWLREFAAANQAPKGGQFFSVGFLANVTQPAATFLLTLAALFPIPDADPAPPVGVQASASADDPTAKLAPALTLVTDEAPAI